MQVRSVDPARARANQLLLGRSDRSTMAFVEDLASRLGVSKIGAVVTAKPSAVLRIAALAFGTLRSASHAPSGVVRYRVWPGGRE